MIDSLLRDGTDAAKRSNGIVISEHCPYTEQLVDASVTALLSWCCMGMFGSTRLVPPPVVFSCLDEHSRRKRVQIMGKEQESPRRSLLLRLSPLMVSGASFKNPNSCCLEFNFRLMLPTYGFCTVGSLQTYHT